MNTARIDAILAGMKSEEVAQALWFVRGWRRFGGMDQAEYDEWTDTSLRSSGSSKLTTTAPPTDSRQEVPTTALGFIA